MENIDVSSAVWFVETDIRTCENQMLKMDNNHMVNIKSNFDTPLERSIALLVRNVFTYYTWDQTLHAFENTLEKFIQSVHGKSIVFVFHSNVSSSSNENNCHQKSSFFFTMLAFRLRPELKNRTVGFICNNTYTIHPDSLKKRNDIIYCICEDSIYSGDQITSVVSKLEKNNRLDISKLHVVCPFVRSGFVERSSSKRYTLHVDVLLPSLMDRLTDKNVLSKTCNKINSNGDDDFENIDNICQVKENIRILYEIFPHMMRHSPVYFSHKTADATSIPLPWLLGILGVGAFSTDDSEAHIANEYVKRSHDEILSCMRGPYKNHGDSMLRLFSSIFSDPVDTKKTLASRIRDKLFTKKK